MKKRKRNNPQRRPRRVTIHTNGRPVPGLPFQGEVMTCVMCGKEQASDPAVESNWRVIEIGGRAFYACPDHFPADDAPKEAFTAAYVKFFQEALKRDKAN